MSSLIDKRLVVVFATPPFWLVKAITLALWVS